MKSTWHQTAVTLEDMILDDPAGRGVREFYIPGELEKAAQSLAASERVILITGFYILAADAAESDGPPGAVVLGRALLRLGKEVLVVTDPANEQVVLAAVAALDQEIPVQVFDPATPEGEYRTLLETWLPTHVVAIERPGRAADGSFYTMRADDISFMTAGLDWLIILAKDFQAVTVGMGDGGNEIGMGRVREQVAACVPFGDKICCSVDTDYIITAGVTNWAAYALVTLLSMQAGINLLHSPEEEARILQAMTEAGCVDGNLCCPAESIDAVPLADHQERIRQMHGLLDQEDIETSAPGT